MAKGKRSVPEINSSSTADIAFLLLSSSLLQHLWILTVVWPDACRLHRKDQKQDDVIVKERMFLLFT